MFTFSLRTLLGADLAVVAWMSYAYSAFQDRYWIAFTALALFLLVIYFGALFQMQSSGKIFKEEFAVLWGTGSALCFFGGTLRLYIAAGISPAIPQMLALVIYCVVFLMILGASAFITMAPYALIEARLQKKEVAHA